MGEYNSASEIIWLPKALYGGAFLRFILEDFEYSLDNGIVLVADNDTQARQFVTEYIRASGMGCKITSWKRRRIYPPNFCCGFLGIKKV